MAYDEDIIETPTSTPNPITADGCLALTVIVTLLMIVVGLPSIGNYLSEGPLPGILTLGMTALVLSILYLATVIRNMAESK
ncbi:MAG: hypothetical protein P1Q69_06200 [Candidatus Thorarchaeota archaeon]|nr:hypothetical protein [Candidatus Thorarchaeota archaeon]